MVENFHKYLGLNIKMLGYMGLTVNFNAVKSRNKYPILEILPTLTTNIICITEVYCRTQSVIKSWNSDLSYALQMLSILFSSFICAFKGLRIATAVTNLRCIMPEMTKMWHENPPQEQRLKKEVLTSAAKSLLISKVYFFHIVLGIGIAAPPVLHFFLNCFASEAANKNCDLSATVYLIEYPFVINNKLVYFMMLVKEEWMFFNSSFYWACCDTMFIQLVTHVILQLKILKFDINYCIKQENNENHLKEHLIKFIKRHQTILRLCHQIETIFSPILFVAMITSSINICLAIFGVQEIFRTSNYKDIATYMFILAGVTYQMLLYCIYADSLTEEAMSVAKAVYDSDWASKNPKFRVYLQIFIFKSQIPVHFTALGFFTVNLRRLVMISKGAVSYFMMLSAHHSS